MLQLVAGLMQTITPLGEFGWYVGIEEESAPGTLDESGTLDTRFAALTGFNDSSVKRAKFNLFSGVAVPPTQSVHTLTTEHPPAPGTL